MNDVVLLLASSALSFILGGATSAFLAVRPVHRDLVQLRVEVGQYAARVEGLERLLMRVLDEWDARRETLTRGG